MGIKIPFTNNYDTWRIATPRDPEAYQLDDNAHKLSVVGDLPDGYVWTMYISVMGKYKDALLLTRDATGASTTLTAENLAYGDVKYSMQLVGVKGEITRKTNEISVYIPKSLIDGDTDWPDRVGAFEEAQTAVLGALTKTPYIDETTGTWFVWSATAGAFVDSGVAAEGPQGNVGPAGAPGTTLGWDVTDDGVGNVEMTYPEAEFGDLNAVRFIQQTLTSAQQTQARENIGAAAASAVDGLTDTVEELDADVLALESISENQESSENVLSYPRAAATTVTGVTLSYNDETGLFTLNGTNTGAGNAIVGASAGTIQDGTALKPPAGVYRLELRCEQGMNPDVFWGVLYIGSQARYVLTDATGDTVEVYLDGNTMASAGVVVAKGETADRLTLSFALRRVGTPEIGKLLVDQINQVRGLQRKLLSAFDTLRAAHRSLSVHTVMSFTGVDDLNTLDTCDEYSLVIARYSGTTAHSPYSEGLTAGYTDGVVLHFGKNVANGVQQSCVEFALSAGAGTVLRRWKNTYLGGWHSWQKLAVQEG